MFKILALNGNLLLLTNPAINSEGVYEDSIE